MKRLKKSLGQHILAEPWVLKIVEAAAIRPGDNVLEVGPGPGNMTRHLLDAVKPGGRVLAIELDQEWRPSLEALPGLEIAWGDVLTLGLAALLDDVTWRVVANIPYYLTAPLLERLIEQRQRIHWMTLLMQREVAERLDARSGRDVGAISHFVHYHFDTRLAFRVPAVAFTPPPEVESALLVLERRPQPAVDVPEGELFPLIRAGFATRRKMLRRSLRSIVGSQREGPGVLDAMFADAGVSGERRPEDLSLDDWASLARARARLR